MAENGNLCSNNLNNIVSTKEFINRSTIATTTNSSSTILTTSTATSLSGTTTTFDQGLTERDATHFRLRNEFTHGLEYITCLSCGELFISSSILEIYDHYRERPHLRHYSNCFYCQGKVHQYYNNHQEQVKYYHNCLRWKRGEDN